MNTILGSCSLCGGNVIGHSGGWHAIVPPPSPRCIQCGAVAAANVIPMVPAPRHYRYAPPAAGSSAGAPWGAVPTLNPDPLGYDPARQQAGEADALAGRVHPVSEVFHGLRESIKQRNTGSSS